jgi:hypothetical protein
MSRGCELQTTACVEKDPFECYPTTGQVTHRALFQRSLSDLYAKTPSRLLSFGLAGIGSQSRCRLHITDLWHVSGTAECQSWNRLFLSWFCFEYPHVPNHQIVASDRVYPG